jgi:hypothetical protein
MRGELHDKPLLEVHAGYVQSAFCKVLHRVVL